MRVLDLLAVVRVVGVVGVGAVRHRRNDLLLAGVEHQVVLLHRGETTEVGAVAIVLAGAGLPAPGSAVLGLRPPGGREHVPVGLAFGQGGVVQVVLAVARHVGVKARDAVGVVDRLGLARFVEAHHDVRPAADLLSVGTRVAQHVEVRAIPEVGRGLVVRGRAPFVRTAVGTSRDQGQSSEGRDAGFHATTRNRAPDTSNDEGRARLVRSPGGNVCAKTTKSTVAGIPVLSPCEHTRP